MAGCTHVCRRAATCCGSCKNGYGWMPGEQYIKDQAAIVDKAVSNADIVITTALLPAAMRRVLLKLKLWPR